THADDDMTVLHIANFVDAIRTGAALHQPIEEGAKSVLLGHLGNIAQSTGRALRTDPKSGHIVGDDEAMRFWQREYARGWARGVPLETLLDGDARKVWQLFAEHYFLFRGTPTGAWLDHELHDVFGIEQQLTGETARSIYDAIAERLCSLEFRPRALFERFNIEVLATTDMASDPLDHHRAIRESG